MPGNRSREKPNFSQQAAKFSWAAPLAALLIGSCINAGKMEQMTSIVMGGFNALLILTGLAMGIIALFGMRRHGRDRVLVPAIIGICINGIMVLAMGTMFLVVAHGAKAAKVAAARAAAPRIITAQDQDEAVFVHDGWAGEATSGKTELTLVQVEPLSNMDRQIQLTNPVRSRILILFIDNSANQNSVTIDTATTKLVDIDGNTLPSLSSDKLSGNFAATASLFGKYGRPAVIPAKTADVILGVFVPPDVNFKTLKQISVVVDGQELIIPGGIVTGAQKEPNRRAFESANGIKAK
ncbi:MAG TPA: hypothetical protein VFE47_24435 [Tepidisphaeraceae bacterium]|nr:hypothetical protein [Tepidisphaeraceae bacterium]